MGVKMLNIEEFWRRGFIKTDCLKLGIDLNSLYIKAYDYMKEKIGLGINDRSINMIEGGIGSFHELHSCSEFMNQCMGSKVLEMVGGLFEGQSCEFRAAEYFAKPAVVGLESPWHQDNYYWCLKKGNAVTIWMAIDRASSLNGGVTYLEGSHNLGTKGHVDSFAPGSSQTIDKLMMNEYLHTYNLVTPVLSPGECIIHHSNIIHGSSINTSSFSRRGLTLQVKTIEDTYDVLKKAEYENNLARQIQERSSIK